MLEGLFVINMILFFKYFELYDFVIIIWLLNEYDHLDILIDLLFYLFF